jgi:hypothetical protein
MKLKIIFFILTVFPVCAQLCPAQTEKPPKAVLVDKFLEQPFGSTIARIDNFVVHLSYNPNSDGYVVIYPEKNSIKQSFRREKRYKEIIINRFYQVSGLDEKRFLIVRGEEKEEMEIELWEVPTGAEKPFSVLEIWQEKPRNLSKAFIFGSEDIEEAYPDFAPRRFAKLLNENPNLRAHIVIFNKSKKEQRAEMQNWLKLFTEDYKLPSRRLKFFFAKNNGRPDVEFWIVPQK